MKLRIFLLTLVLNWTLTTAAFAHALWIETTADGTAGKTQDVKIYYGEYAAQEFEATDKWYSDVNTFALWLTLPDGSKKQLTYKSVEKAFAASFVPEKGGVYILTIGHSAREIDGTMVYQFNASAVVTVKGSSESGINAVSGNELYLQPVKDATGKAGVVKAFFKGKPAANITIAVSGPTGWTKSFQTDANGELKFDLLWKGWYALEGFYTTQEKGNLYDNPYEQIWRCATLRINL